MMKFPKKIMKMTELMEMGFPEEYLRRAYVDKNQDFASKMNPLAKNSTILFDTEGFWKWWLADINLQKKTMQRG